MSHDVCDTSACPVRAITRCGELLKAIQPASGLHMKQEGALPFQTREQAAEDAGLSEHQRQPATGWGKRWGRPKP